MKSPFRNVRIWRASFHKPDGIPTFSGHWQMSDWRKEKFASGYTVVEERILPFSQLHSVKFSAGRLFVQGNKLQTSRSRRSSEYFYAMQRERYEGDVQYTEGCRDE